MLFDPLDHLIHLQLFSFFQLNPPPDTGTLKALHLRRVRDRLAARRLFLERAHEPVVDAFRRGVEGCMGREDADAAGRQREEGSLDGIGQSEGFQAAKDLSMSF